MAQSQEINILRGGLDLVSLPVEIGPGFCIASKNYECGARGYSRIKGWERFDGQPKPSEAAYWLLDFKAGQTAGTAGQIVTGATSGATGVLLYDMTADTGSFGGNDAEGEMVLTDVVGAFTNNEDLQISGATIAVSAGFSNIGAASTLLPTRENSFDSQYRQRAEEVRRDVITAVPGSGKVLGIATLEGEIYAFRNNAGGTAAVMHKATPSGWVAQSFGHKINFDSGDISSFTEGETVTGGTSGATAKIERIALLSGSMDGSGVGYLVLSGISGTFQSGETLTGDTSGATASSTSDAGQITLPPGGHYRNVVYNFYGPAQKARLYVVNGEGPAFEWDGSVMAPIHTGLPKELDKPHFVAVHANHLFLGYEGGTINYQGTGEPHDARAVAGAGTIGFGESLTGLKSSTRTVTIVMGRNKVGYIQGNDTNDFVLNFVSEDSGGVADTLEVLGQPYFLDDLGVRSLEASEAFGDFGVGAMSRRVEPFIRQKREAGIHAVGAMRVRSKNQYRLFYSDGTGLSAYFGREEPEIMQFDLMVMPTSLFSGELQDGSEILLFGDSNGWVYEMDAGNGADGKVIEAYIRFPFVHQGTPNSVKRYHRAFIDVIGGTTDASLLFAVDFDYGNPGLPSGTQSDTITGQGGFWDEELFWERFIWDAPTQGQGIVELSGIGRNLTVAVVSEAAYEDPHTLSSITMNFTKRRQTR